jgi:type I restriction enzyme, S subunit
MTAGSVNEWREVALGKILRIEHGYAFKGEHFVSAGTDVLLTPKNFRAEGGLDVSSQRCRYYDGPVDESFVLMPGDVVVAMTDLKQDAPILGAAGTVPTIGRYLHNQRIGKVVVREPGRLDATFAPWLLNSPLVRSRIRQTATGSTVRHSAPTRIEEVTVMLPDLRTQRCIADVLSAFDRLIDINDRRIVLLEDLVRSFYRDWFLRFRFPGHEDVEFVESELGVIPDGWNICTLADIARVVSDWVAPSDVATGSPYVGLEHLPRRATTLRAWGDIESVTSRKLRFLPGDTLFGKIRPYFHKVVWAPFVGVTSADTIVVRACGEQAPSALVNAILSSGELVARAVATSNGTKMPRVDPAALLGYPLVLPPSDSAIVGNFEQISSAYLLYAATLSECNRRLAAARNLLLPRLVTGQLDVFDLDLGDLLPVEAE